ncbi:CPBP family intramembrane metalloprotease [Litorilinea aerophila]|uniref:CPBP family intramembrane metalloprotease n=1 Tax=Litorilinea aerophila TaxID=1204385 RepID=A0A540VFD1_9CHLR|nr:CPBP family intramembrane glutamic endopeptidase [Litorilinea aerophila]MCC9076750.1 CPBP family intramembrane metalloprotease [Litorilinea aerophila]OUC05129.1 hypothetical protein RY27_29115 [Litorilinea aerophila]
MARLAIHRPIHRRRVVLFLLLAFGLAWATALVIYGMGGLNGGPALVPGVLNLATVLVALVYMPAPALAHVLTRLWTREGWQGSGLRPHLRRAWPYWLAAWVLPALLTLLGSGLYFLLFPHQFDPSLGVLRQLLAQAGRAEPPISLSALAALQLIQAVLLAPLVNGLFTFGEEFGWRAYLQPKLLPLGWRPAMVLMGIIWGLWHAPLIAMGHNYGVGYPGAPWSGILAMIWFTFVVGTFLGWLTVQGRSVWPAVIGHAAINGVGTFPALLTQGEPNPLLGPLPVGLIGSAGFTLVALWCLWREPTGGAGDEEG